MHDFIFRVLKAVAEIFINTVKWNKYTLSCIRNFPEFMSSIGKLDEIFKNCNVRMHIKMIKKTINDTLTVRYAVIL